MLGSINGYGMLVMFLCWTAADAVARTVRGTVMNEAARQMTAPIAKAGIFLRSCHVEVPDDDIVTPTRSSDGQDWIQGFNTLFFFGEVGTSGIRDSILAR